MAITVASASQTASKNGSAMSLLLLSGFAFSFWAVSCVLCALSLHRRYFSARKEAT
jgi:hypothetical protein